MTKVDDKRQAILKATLRLISEHGFHGTAMSKVAREAGVSAGIIYHYFKNKDELIVELYKEIKRTSSEAQLAQLDQTQPIRLQIQHLLATIIRYFLEHPDETAFLNQFITSPYHTPEVEAAVQAFYAPIIECHEKAIREMIIKDMPIAVYGTFAVDVPGALVRRQAAGQIELTDELVEQVIDSLWQAIRL